MYSDSTQRPDTWITVGWSTIFEQSLEFFFFLRHCFFVYKMRKSMVPKVGRPFFNCPCFLTCLTKRGTDCPFVLECLFKDVCVVTNLGWQRYCCPQKKGAVMLISGIIDLSFPTSEFLSSNTSHCMCRCHRTFFAILVRIGAGELVQDNADTQLLLLL